MTDSPRKDLGLSAKCVFPRRSPIQKGSCKEDLKGKRECAPVRVDRESPAEDRDQAQTAEGAVGASAMNFDI